MSGGSFNYDCHRISDFARELRHKLDINNSEEKDRYGDYIGAHMEPETVAALEGAYVIINTASLLAREVEWLYSFDHSEASFRELVDEIMNGVLEDEP